MSVTDEIKSRLDIVDIVSDYLPLRKSGSSYSGFCPFHSNTRTPSFVVFPNTQTWRCFGACAEGGDVFSFVMKKEGWDFKEALQHLARRAGVSLDELSPADKARREEENKLGDLLTAAADYFHQLLLYAPQAEAARQYIAGRALSDETVETFQLGFALNSWDACRSHFNMQGYPDEDLVDAGLLTENPEKGTRYDRFRNRLMIPIRNAGGQVAGFGARTLDPDGIPKYLNSPQTTLFDKSRLLYGLDLAKRHIREARQAVIVEGYMDVMQAWQAGFRNVVAQMGTALTDDQLRQLKRYTKRFVLALDADAAGAKATLRSLEVAREALDREVEVRFDARGLVRHEGRLQADIRIVTLPEGNDPDQIIRRDPTLWPKLLDSAKPVVEYVIGVATQDLDMNDAKAKTAAARQVLPLIADVIDPVEREHYRQLLARTLRVDERALRQIALPAAPERRRASSERQSSASKDGRQSRKPHPSRSAALSGGPIAVSLREANYLSQCLRYPGIFAQVNQRLEQHQQPPVSEADFTAAEDKSIFRLMQRHYDNGTVVTLEDLWDSLQDDLLRERLSKLRSFPETPDSEFGRLPTTLVLSILEWRREKIRELIGEVRQLRQEIEPQTNPDGSHIYAQKLQELMLRHLQISKAKEAMSALGRR